MPRLTSRPARSPAWRLLMRRCRTAECLSPSSTRFTKTPVNYIGK
jgi:hypothetical protein